MFHVLSAIGSQEARARGVSQSAEMPFNAFDSFGWNNRMIIIGDLRVAEDIFHRLNATFFALRYFL